jgi:aldose 1-epimerase
MPLTVTEEPLGEVEGDEVRRYTLDNTLGMRVRILNYGGIVQAIEFPDRHGRPANIVLGFRTLEEYLRFNPARNPENPDGAGIYFGALIGRYANPLGNGTFSLAGKAFHVPMNSEWHALHGGTVGFDQKVWKATVVSGDSSAGLRLGYVSPAGEMGFPGTLDVVATFTLDDKNQLTLRFEAVSDAPTVLNLTNHIYWNLAGESSGSIYEHLLQINADGYTPVNGREVPTGEIAPVVGTPFDFTRPIPIGERIRAADEQLLIGHGYDHNWVLKQTDPPSLIRAARAVDPRSGRALTVDTTQPGLQFYSGNLLPATVVGSGGGVYRQGDGFAMEAQHFPDAPNHPNFPSAELAPGEVYRQTIVYGLTVED